MKHLSRFTSFDCDEFFKGKKLVVVDHSKPWVDYSNPNTVLGTKITCVITEDFTNYGAETEGNNRYEKLIAKVKKPNLNISIDSEVKFIGASARVYGDYNHLLSVTAEDIKVVEKK